MTARAFINDHRKPLRVIAAVVAFAMIAVLLEFANELLGNPVSYLIAKNNAKKYVEEKYPGAGYVIESVDYSFKFKDYFARAAKPGSEDCYFTVFYNMFGEFRGDNFTVLVENGGNVERRLETGYRQLADSVLESSANPYRTERAIQFGELIFESDPEKPESYDFGLSRDILVPDGQYDLAELGAEGGLIVFNVDVQGEATPEKAAEVLLKVREIMERGGVPFFAIDLALKSPSGNYYLENFHRADIYEDGLAERVRQKGMTTEEFNAHGEAK
ncbi:MAG: hypothetical protein K2N56_07545 [Oscillospiraceae bacterium]|nr:hypothetical protein [Oscillospiraceae bacterium]